MIPLPLCLVLTLLPIAQSNARETPSVVPATQVQAAKQVAPAAPMKSLGLGDAAPAFQVDQWIKGDPITTLEAGKVHVIEFWATWCGPCIKVMPHLTQVQKDHPEVIVISVAASERGSDESAKLEKVKTFVNDKGDGMGYRVVYASDPAKMSLPWMRAAGQNGIPCSFIVDGTGKVAWIGHPQSMDAPLAKILDGSWDLAAEVKRAAPERAANEIRRAVALALRDAKTTGNYSTAIDALRQAINVAPNDALKIQLIQILAGPAEKPAEAWVVATDVLESGKTNPSTMNQLAWMIADDKEFKERNLDIALQAAQRACELTKNNEGAMLDTLAAIYFLQNNTVKAIAIQQEALGCTPDGAMKTGMEATLKKYEAALSKT